MNGGIPRWVFWGSLGSMAYVLAGFPALVAARARRRLPVAADGPERPLTVVLAAHDEAAVIARKVRNTLALEYPAGMLDLVVACDGCTDDTATLAREAAGDGPVTVLDLPRGGKNAALREAIAAADGEVLLFTDADAMLRPDAARRLVAALGDPAVGGAAGRVVFGGDATGARGERAHWGAEDRLRRRMTEGGSMTSATGPLYVVRRDLVCPPPDGVTDDFWVSVHVPLRGWRLVFVADAVADLPPPPDARGEFRRKVRIISAGLRGVWGVRGEMRGRWIDLQVVTHKGLRRLMAVPAALTVVSGLLLWPRGTVYRAAGGVGAAIAALAVAGWRLRDTPAGRVRLLSLPAFAGSVALASLVALRDLVRGTRHDTWTTGD